MLATQSGQDSQLVLDSLLKKSNVFNVLLTNVSNILHSSPKEASK